MNVPDQIPRSQDVADTTDSPERLSASDLFGSDTLNLTATPDTEKTKQKLIQVKTQRRITSSGKREIFLVGMNQWVEEAECKNPNATLMVGSIEIPWDRLLTPDEANQPVVDLSRILDALPEGFRLSDLQGTESISTYVHRLSESNTRNQKELNELANRPG